MSGCFLIKNCIFVTNAASLASCINGTTADNTSTVLYCAFYNNTQDIVTGSSYPGFKVVGKITLTGDPIVNPATGNFGIDNTTGEGALLRGLGWPATYNNGLTANALDVGPSQHSAAAGGCELIGMGGGLVNWVGG